MSCLLICLAFLVRPSLSETGNYVCEVCGKQYKYFNPYQEHVALHTPMGELLIAVVLSN